jgi:hypothetical protein
MRTWGGRADESVVASEGVGSSSEWETRTLIVGGLGGWRAEAHIRTVLI